MSTTKEIIIPKIELNEVNVHLDSASAQDSIHWAYEKFQGGLRFLTSAGADSALLINEIRKTGLPIKGLLIDTGFLFDSTLEFKNELERWSGLPIDTHRAEEEVIETVSKQRIWEKDKDEYSRLTKLDTMTEAIDRFAITALLAGVRGEQNANRAGLRRVEEGNDGEYRIHPLLHVSKEQAADTFERDELPRPPLYYHGYESIGDWTTTIPGKGREGRQLGFNSECGLHIGLAKE